jgi:hypothetical protein
MMRLLRIPLSLLTAGVVLAGLLSSTDASAFDARNPAAVGVIVMPFETARDEDESLGFLLEDFLRAHLERRLRRPVHVGSDVLPALTGRPRDCLIEVDCVRLLGGQFNSSLVALVVVRRTGDTVTLDVDWYTTGNGLKIAHETTSFASDRSKEMLAAFSMWVDRFFDTSLRVTAENRAEDGGLLTGRNEARRVQEYERGRRRTVSSRREDFQGDGDARIFDRDDPTGSLRALVGDDDEPERAERRGAQRRRNPRELPPIDEDLSLDDPYDDPDDFEDLDEPERSSPRRSAPPPRPARREPVKETALSANDARGDSLAGYNDAQHAGYGTREVRRFQRSGLDFPSYDDRRWSFGKRFHIRANFVYALGGLTRRYSSLVHIRAGGLKTEEYSWESLGLSFVNPGIQLGFGIAPVDIFEFGVDFGLMYGSQALRREYIDQSDPDETIVSICTEQNCPDEATWKTAPTVHWTVDFGARFFIVPRGRVKPWAGLAGTLLFMAGYEIAPDGRYDHASRPPAVMFGITPQGGVALAISPFVSLNIGFQGTFLAVRGNADYVADEFYNGATAELGAIPEETKEIPHRAEPWMMRVFVGPMILF